jgi:hypothetical protein
MFSLCIPTMDRFDSFLSVNLPKYLENEYIDEIIITDENGNDIEKINNHFPNNPKIILIKNEKRLGPFLNKLKVCSYAKNEWIALIDSDNFADKNYFIIAKDYITENIKDEKNIILSPCRLKPNFDFTHLSNFIFTKNNIQENLELEKKIIQPNNCACSVLFNAGNYIINKYLINNLNIDNELENIEKSSACDVIYFNILLLEQLNLNLHVVPNLEYEHVVHNKSIYIQTASHNVEFAKWVHERFFNMR